MSINDDFVGVEDFDDVPGEKIVFDRCTIRGCSWSAEGAENNEPYLRHMFSHSPEELSTSDWSSI